VGSYRANLETLGLKSMRAAEGVIVAMTKDNKRIVIGMNSAVEIQDSGCRPAMVPEDLKNAKNFIKRWLELDRQTYTRQLPATSDYIQRQSMETNLRSIYADCRKAFPLSDLSGLPTAAKPEGSGASSR